MVWFGRGEEQWIYWTGDAGSGAAREEKKIKTTEKDSRCSEGGDDEG